MVNIFFIKTDCPEKWLLWAPKNTPASHTASFTPPLEGPFFGSLGCLGIFIKPPPSQVVNLYHDEHAPDVVKTSYRVFWTLVDGLVLFDRFFAWSCLWWFLYFLPMVNHYQIIIWWVFFTFFQSTTTRFYTSQVVVWDFFLKQYFHNVRVNHQLRGTLW